MEQHRDEHLTCADCSAPFLFSASEAQVFAERGLASPKRCKDCRRARKERNQQQGLGGGGGFARPHQDRGPPRDLRSAPRPQGRRDGGFDSGYGNSSARAPRYTGDVNEYRSPMQDNGYAASPAPWGSDGGFAPRAPRRPPPAGPRPGPRFQGGPPPWANDGQYRAPAPAHRAEPAGFDRGPAPLPRRRPQAEMFSITCNSCGVKAEVPFRPAEGRDVFCQACYCARKPT